ncbi:glutathionylspermidine synthase family protein [Micromonospora fluostatini]|uniref:Glutathionylspermidine synthase family protein n=1 Tax=Micromonospora fluostatini TaxID=1629071 RepID=A0ABY2DIR2_9ACTN|nr:glutathionylspermidine synthase family protein [Micromonospora fluostatini]
MRRAHGVVRSGWQATNHAHGLIYNNTELPDGTTKSYWAEGPYYVLSMDEVRELEEATQALNQMRIAAGDHIAARCPRRDRAVRSRAYLTSVCNPATCPLSRIGVPEFAHEQVLRTWFDGDVDTWTHHEKDLDGRYPHQSPDYSPNVYGRYDLWYGGAGTTPKLLEFNAQTPTGLIEASVIQWNWLEQTGQNEHPEWQFNSIHDRLVGWEPGDGDPGCEGAWRRTIAALRAARPWLPEKPKVFFAYETSEVSGEDRMTTAYLQDTCSQAGFPTELIAMSQIAWDTADDRIVFKRNPADPGCPEEPIDIIFVLYPWEWIWSEEIGKAVFRDMARPDKSGTVWIEPPYTAALWGNKALLPVMWKLFGDKPEGRYLLPAYFEEERPAAMTSYAIKPIWGREGNGVILVRDGQVIADGGYSPSDAVPRIVQELAELPAFDSLDGPVHPVIGSWVIDGEPAGVGIREGGPITNNLTSFVPHAIGADAS